MEIITCQKCGETLLDDTQGCPFCGTKSARPPTRSGPPAAPANREPRRSTQPQRREHENVPEVQPRKSRPGSDRIDLDADDDQIDALSDPVPAPLPPVPVEDRGHKRAKYVFDDKFRDFKDKAQPVRLKSGAPGDLEVTCPICRTAGFIPKGAVGQPLHCRNKDCPAPVFVHRVDKPPQPLPQPGSESPATPKIGMWVLRGAALVLVIAAVSTWWIFASLRKKDSGPHRQPVAVATVSPVEPVAPPEPVVETKSAPETEKANDLEGLRKSGYAALTNAIQQAPPNRKATGLRLSATSAVLAGDFAAAQEQLAQFRVVPELAQYQFEAVLPLTALAWKHLEAGRQSAFLEAVVNASDAARKLPSRGRFAAQSSISLAALLAVAERLSEAVQLVSSHQNGNSVDDAAAALALAADDGSFNVLLPRPGQQFGRWDRPLPAAVTCLLMQRKQHKTAEAWSSAQTDGVARDECRLLWASQVAEQTMQVKRAADSQLAMLPGLDASPATQARWYARLALIYHGHGLTPAATQSLELARREFSKIPSGASGMQFKNIPELLKLEMPKESVSVHAAACATAEIALTQFRLGQTDAAAKSLDLALNRWRKSAPSLVALSSLEKSLLEGGPAAARQRLRQTLNLDDDDTAARELNRVRQKLASLQEVAQARFLNQERLLLVALDWGMADAVWQEVQRRHNQTDPNEQEPYLRSALPQILAGRFQAAGKQQQLQEVQNLLARLKAVLGENPPVDNRVPLVKETTSQLATSGLTTEAGRMLATESRDDGSLDLWTLQLACWQARQEKFERVVELLTPLGNQALREDALRLAAALATREKHHEQVAAAAATRGGIPLESAAIYAGLLEGLAAGQTDRK